jgi:hypothetical protein
MDSGLAPFGAPRNDGGVIQRSWQQLYFPARIELEGELPRAYFIAVGG